MVLTCAKFTFFIYFPVTGAVKVFEAKSALLSNTSVSKTTVVNI